MAAKGAPDGVVRISANLAKQAQYNARLRDNRLVDCDVGMILRCFCLVCAGSLELGRIPVDEKYMRRHTLEPGQPGMLKWCSHFAAL